MLEIVNRVDGKYPFRVYEMSNGEFYPSATSITGLIHEKDIAQWKARVGLDEANRVSERASSHGTRFHELMEDYLNGKERKLEPFNEFFSVYNTIKRDIYPKITDVKYVEKQLFSSTLKCAGTMDLFAKWENKNAIIDWKTTSYQKDIKDVTNYFAQEAAYAYMLRENFGIVAEKLILVFNVKDTYVYTLEQTDIQKWVDFFMKYRKEFYRRYKV